MRIIDKKEEKVILIEMSCPWVNNRVVKVEEKTRKYGRLRLELKKQYPGYKIIQHKIIMDVLGWVLGRSKGFHTKSRRRAKLNSTKKDAESHANKYKKHCKKYEDTTL